MNGQIAIVGMSARYAGAPTLAKYWNNLRNGICSIGPIPPNRWDMSAHYDPRPRQKGKIYCGWLGYLEGAEYFDPLFFNMAPSEAELIDPQHRVFVEEGYKAFEDAGYGPRALSKMRCGVYLGIIHNEYRMMLQKARNDSVAYSINNSFSLGAARLAYHLNLRGPAIPIDTACSSSLVAVHLACQALLNEEIDMALIGGTTLFLTAEAYIAMCEAGMLSVSGKCRAFDNSADGFVPGEGVGTLLLKRLIDAQSDGDDIRGVIIGSGINNDGKTNGITAPSLDSQFQLLREIYARDRINPETLDYIEAHGTGTKLGDPIELKALSAAFKENTSKLNYCAIGSVKTNIGHTSAAAGVAGIHKILLCMKNNCLVPSLNFEVPNENFSFSDSPLYVNTELRGWCRSGNLPRRAAVSSFGLSGTNAHVVIEEYARNSLTRRHQKGETRDCAASLEASIAATPLLFQENTSARDLNKLEDASCITITEDVGSEASERRLTKKAPVSDRLLYESRPGYLVMLSGRTLEQLRRQVEQLAEYCEVCADLNWGNVCYTLLIGRKHFSFRLACTVTGDESGVDLSDRLRRWLEKGVATRVYNSKVSESDIRDQEAPLQSNGERHIEECAAGNLQPTEYLQRLEGLAELYTQGYGLKYESLFAGGYSRVPLPTYPFARQRYWIQQPIQKKVTVAAPLAADHVDPALLNILDRVENGSLDIDSAIRVLQDSKIIMRFE